MNPYVFVIHSIRLGDKSIRRDAGMDSLNCVLCCRLGGESPFGRDASRWLMNHDTTRSNS
jgi:hypothetical protein